MGGFILRFYIGQVAICLIEALIFNLYAVASVLWTSGYKDTEERFMRKYGWGHVRAAIMLRLLVIFFAIPILAYGLFTVTNAAKGWFVFHINDVFTVIWFPLFFIFLPGCLIALFAIGVVEYIVRDAIVITKRCI